MDFWTVWLAKYDLGSVLQKKL